MPEDGLGGARPTPATRVAMLRGWASGPAMLGAELRRRVLRCRPRRPGRDAVRRAGLGLGALARLPRRRVRIGLASTGALVRHRQGVPVLGRAAAGVQRVRPLPAPEGPTVTWRWLFFLSGMDIALITAAVIIGGDFHLFSYVTYYPALALFAVVFASLWLSLAWATMAGAIYAVVSLKRWARVSISMRVRRRPCSSGWWPCMPSSHPSASSPGSNGSGGQESAERERELLRERIELSQAIHDTAAQTAYMIGLGICPQGHEGLAGGSNEELSRHAGRDRIAVEGGHLGVAASHRRGPSLRGEGAGPGALVAHRDI